MEHHLLYEPNLVFKLMLKNKIQPQKTSIARIVVMGWPPKFFFLHDINFLIKHSNGKFCEKKLNSQPLKQLRMDIDSDHHVLLFHTNLCSF